MTSVVQPDLIPQPWSQNGSHTTIPDTTSEFGRASWSLGFPPETALPLNAGGIPPNWLDFQGVLNALSQHACFEQVGGRYTWVNTQNFPVGACIIGSNNLVYQALQESGPDTAAGAKNPVTAANSAYWGVVATPDGSTIKIVNGKLAADSSTIATAIADGTTIKVTNGKIGVGAQATATLLADGTSIVASNGKLSAVGGGGGGGGDAASLVDNVTTVANNSKITVDFTDVTAAALSNITPNMIQSGGGLAADSTTGKLVVDLDYIIPLTANLGIYVDGSSGSDTIVDGRGTVDLPFATIQAAVNYVTRTFALRNHNVSIIVTPGTYGAISLPSYVSTTGRIVITKASGVAGNVVISSSDQAALVCIDGLWTIRNINFSSSHTKDSSSWGASVCVGDDIPANVFSNEKGVSPVLNLENCNLSVSYSGSAPSNSDAYRLSCVFANSGRLEINDYDNSGGTTWNCTKGNAPASFLYARRGANVEVVSSPLIASGTCSEFCRADEMSYVHFGTTSFSSSSVTGKKYTAKRGSGIVATTALPGSVAGEAEVATYSWYAEGLL